MEGILVESSQEVVRILTQHDPLERFIGWPEGKQFEARQRRAKMEVEQQYGAAVSALLVGLPDLFGEKVD